MTQIEPIVCDLCKTILVSVDEHSDIQDEQYYEIQRCVRSFNIRENSIEEDVSDRNVKFGRIVCIECFRNRIAGVFDDHH